MSDTATVKKQLKIKTGAVSRSLVFTCRCDLRCTDESIPSGRLWKDYALYTKEEEQLRTTLDKFKEDGAEAWDIKNTVRPDQYLRRDRTYRIPPRRQT